MPTYEFRCPNGHEFERFYKKISDAPSEVACPECGATSTRAISGGAGLLFKGSGFYLTDYGRNAHRSGSAPSKPSGSSESKSAESKPAESKSSESSGSSKSSEAAPAKKPDSGKGRDT